MKNLLRTVLSITLPAVLLCGAVLASESRVVYESTVNAGVDQVWEAFTTSDGLRMWMAPLVEIDLKVGGKMRSSYNPEGRLGDASTIENTILAYDPGRMLALKATRFPEGAPYVEDARNLWSVFYFDAVAPDRTKITIVGLGYTGTEGSTKLRDFFSTANDQLIRKLDTVLAGRERQASED